MAWGHNYKPPSGTPASGIPASGSGWGGAPKGPGVGGDRPKFEPGNTMGSRPTNEERVAWRAEKAFAMEQVLAEIAENPKELGMTRAGAAAKLHAIIEGAPTTSGKMTVDGQLTLAQLVAQSYSADT